jgi:hypothetical protein
VTILEIGDVAASQPWHNVGSLMFDAEGALLALVGDKTVGSNARDPTNPLGGIIRLSPSRIEGVGGFTLQPDPPYARPGQSPLLLAIGVRSPWKGFVDARGRVFFGDVGEGSYEEVNVLTTPGSDFGWPLHEGPCREGCEGFTDPLRIWDRSETHPFVAADPDAVLDWPRAVWVAPGVPPGQENPYRDRLSDVVLYGDLCVGFVRAMVVDADGAIIRDEAIGHLPNSSGWDVGPDGTLYAVTFADRCTTNSTAAYGASRLYRLEPRRPE